MTQLIKNICAKILISIYEKGTACAVPFSSASRRTSPLTLNRPEGFDQPLNFFNVQGWG